MDVLAYNLRPTDMIEGGRMVTSVKIKVRRERPAFANGPRIPGIPAPAYVIESTNVLLDTGMGFTLDSDRTVRVVAFFDALHEQSWN